MSLSDRRMVLSGLGLALLGLPGCLRPMLAKGEAAAELRGRVSFPTIKDRFGYFLNESLSSRLGRTGKAAYRLEVGSAISEAGVAIARDSSATRINVLVRASWRLVRISDGQPVLSDSWSCNPDSMRRPRFMPRVKHAVTSNADSPEIWANALREPFRPVHQRLTLEDIGSGRASGL